MKSNLPLLKSAGLPPINFRASCLPTSSRLKPAPDAPMALPPEALNAVSLQPTLSGGLCLAEVVSFDGLIVTFREFRKVASFAEAVAVSGELKRPLLESLQIRAILEKGRHENQPSKPALGMAATGANQAATMVAPTGADSLPAETKDWSLFALKGGRELEAQGLTLTDALNLQLAEIHCGATWTEVYRTNRTFVIYDDIDNPEGEEHWAGANLTNANREGK